MELLLDDKELQALQDMLQIYRELEEEIYDYPEDPTTLFTKAQLRLFQRLDIVSITTIN